MRASKERQDVGSILILCGFAAVISGTLLASSIPLIQSMHQLDFWNATQVSMAFHVEVKNQNQKV